MRSACFATFPAELYVGQRFNPPELVQLTGPGLDLQLYGDAYVTPTGRTNSPPRMQRGPRPAVVIVDDAIRCIVDDLRREAEYAVRLTRGVFK